MLGVAANLLNYASISLCPRLHRVRRIITGRLGRTAGKLYVGLPVDESPVAPQHKSAHDERQAALDRAATTNAQSPRTLARDPMQSDNSRPQPSVPRSLACLSPLSHPSHPTSLILIRSTRPLGVPNGPS